MKSKFIVKQQPKRVPLTKLIVAYCIYPQSNRIGEPVIGAEYLAKVIIPLGFSDKYDIEYKTCLAVPDQLPSNISPTSEEGLRLLGMLDTDIRFCSYGVSSVLKSTWNEMKNDITLTTLQAPFKWGNKLHGTRVHSPRTLSIYTYKNSNLPVKPLLTRACREPHEEFVYGVPLQFDTKVIFPSPYSFTVYMPYAFESFGRSRWNGNNASRVFEPHGEIYGLNNMFTVRESVTHDIPTTTIPSLFMAMVNSNCKKPTTSIIRMLFGYAVFKTLNKPVHNLGSCPPDPRGAEMAGISVKERTSLMKQHHSGVRSRGKSVSEIFSNYKFAIVFENSNVNGYASEKIISPYVGRSIPVYWGSGNMLTSLFNPKAFIHCDIPLDISKKLTGSLSTSNDPLKLNREFCPQGESGPEYCGEDTLLEMFLPYFLPCIEQIKYLDGNNTAYLEMANAPLGTMDENNKLIGYWNESFYAESIRSIYSILYE